MQAAGHRFVWWPSLLAGRHESVLGEYLRFGRRSSRHLEIPESLWENTHATLPGARGWLAPFPTPVVPTALGLSWRQLAVRRPRMSG